MSESKVIVLYGRGNTGKTTTLNFLIEKLIASGAVFVCGSRAATPKKDSWVILKKDDRKIGIITAGDSEKELDYCFGELCITCDIYVCATRSKGNTCRYIENRFPGHIIMWQEKWSIDEWSGTTKALDRLQKEANEKQAMGLIDAIDELI